MFYIKLGFIVSISLFRFCDLILRPSNYTRTYIFSFDRLLQIHNGNCLAYGFQFCLIVFMDKHRYVENLNNIEITYLHVYFTSRYRFDILSAQL